MALLVQLAIYPVKARERLKESLASAIVQLNKMESYLALGVEDAGNVRATDPALFKQFDKARTATIKSLVSAEAFLGFTAQEPRLKGSFHDQADIYKEVGLAIVPREH